MGCTVESFGRVARRKVEDEDEDEAREDEAEARERRRRRLIYS